MLLGQQAPSPEQVIIIGSCILQRSLSAAARPHSATVQDQVLIANAGHDKTHIYM